MISFQNSIEFISYFTVTLGQPGKSLHRFAIPLRGKIGFLSATKSRFLSASESNLCSLWMFAPMIDYRRISAAFLPVFDLFEVTIAASSSPDGRVEPLHPFVKACAPSLVLLQLLVYPLVTICRFAGVVMLSQPQI